MLGGVAAARHAHGLHLNASGRACGGKWAGSMAMPARHVLSGSLFAYLDSLTEGQDRRYGYLVVNLLINE